MIGVIPISTRIIAKALREQIFANEECRIIVLGKPRVLSKEESLKKLIDGLESNSQQCTT